MLRFPVDSKDAGTRIVLQGDKMQRAVINRTRQGLDFCQPRAKVKDKIDESIEDLNYEYSVVSVDTDTV